MAKRQKSKKSKKPLTLTKLKAELDKAFAKKVRARGKCQRCGRTDMLQCAHIFSRSHMSTRWDEDNALCLCMPCHLYWAHRQPIEFTEWVMNLLGDYRFNELRMKAYRIKQWERWELENMPTA